MKFFLKPFKAFWMLAKLARLAALRAFGPASGDLAPKRILILGYAAVGDFVYLLPAWRALRKAFPQAHITFVADSYFVAEELAGPVGFFDALEKIDILPQTCAEARRAARFIRSGNFDVAIVTHATPLSFFARALMSVPARIGQCRRLVPRTEGWSALRRWFWSVKRGLVTDEFARRLAFTHPVWLREESEHRVPDNLRLVEPLTGPLDAEASAPPELPVNDAAREAAKKALGEFDGATVALHIGSPKSQYKKIWPAEQWAELCRELRRRCGARFVLLGGPDEAEVAERFLSVLSDGVVNIAGKFGLSESFAVMERCDLVLAADTGMGKCSMALGVPTAILWGPSDHVELGIFWEPQKHLALTPGISCAPCIRLAVANEGPGLINYENCGHNRCLNERDPAREADRIWSHYKDILGSA